MASAAVCNSTMLANTLLVSSTKMSYSKSFIFDSAAKTFSSSSFSFWVIKRSAFTNVCFLTYLSGTKCKFDFVTSM